MASKHETPETRDGALKSLAFRPEKPSRVILATRGKANPRRRFATLPNGARLHVVFVFAEGPVGWARIGPNGIGEARAPFVTAIREGRKPPTPIAFHPRVDAAALRVAEIAAKGRVAHAFELWRDAAGLVVEALATDRALVLAAKVVSKGDDVFVVMVADRLIRLWASDAGKDAGAQELEPPLVDRREALLLLLAERGGVHDLARSPFADVIVEQTVKHCFEAARPHLRIERREIGFVLLVGVADLLGDVAALLLARGNDVVVVRRDHRMQSVGDFERVDALWLDEQSILGDEPFECAFGLLVARSDGFVREQEETHLHRGLALPGHVQGRGDVSSVLAEDAAHGAPEQAFAGSKTTDEDECDFGLPGGVLNAIGQPIEDIVVNGSVARRQHFKDMLLHQTPVPFAGLNAEAAPQIDFALDDRVAAREEGDALIGVALIVFEPPIADREGLAVAVHSEGRAVVIDAIAIRIELSEVLKFEVGRQPIGVFFAARVMADILEPQHPSS